MAKKQTAKELRERWSALQASQINQMLVAGTLDRSAIARIQHGDVSYLDLRGLRREGGVEETTLQHIDFSFSDWSLGWAMLYACRVEDCLFRGADLETKLDRDFIRCDFSRAKLGTMYGQYVDCDFSFANMSRAGVHASFVRCDFSGANLRGNRMMRCEFRDCNFTDAKFGMTSLSWSKFINSPIDPAQLDDTNAMTDVEWIET